MPFCEALAVAEFAVCCCELRVTRSANAEAANALTRRAYLLLCGCPDIGEWGNMYVYCYCNINIINMQVSLYIRYEA